jgi:hypothetical protein
VTERIAVFVEAVRTKAFASALDWPGWSRSAKTPREAVEALLAYAPRYESVASDAGLVLAASSDVGAVEIVETIEGDASTAFGVPSRLSERDRQPLAASEANRRADLVAAAWRRFDAVAAGAPAELRKGPRGGGRDTARIVEHVIGSDHGYTRELDIRIRPPDPTDAAAVAAMRDAMLVVLRRPSDGSPIVKRWTPAYAARRIAWHALDHAWEIEDRTER